MKESIFDDRSRSEWEALIDEWVHDELSRRMLKRKYLDGICYEDLPKEFFIGVDGCKKRIKKAKEQLFRHI